MVYTQWHDAYIGLYPATINILKTRKRRRMNIDERKKLEEQLKKMINKSDNVKAKKEQPVNKTGDGNVIRRRAGEKDKRFFV